MNDPHELEVMREMGYVGRTFVEVVLYRTGKTVTVETIRNGESSAHRDFKDAVDGLVDFYKTVGTELRQGRGVAS